MLSREGGAYQLSSLKREGGLLEGGGLFERGNLNRRFTVIPLL